MTNELDRYTLVWNQRSADFSFGGDTTATSVPSLKVYLIVILQLTTLSLLFSLSSSAAQVLPAMLPVKPVVASVVETSVPLIEVKAPVAIDSKVKDKEPISNSKNAKRFVEDYFKDTPILANIARCESRYRQYDTDGNVLRGIVNSLDVGVMQINEKYHLETAKKLGYNIYTIEGNTAYAKYIYDREGAKPWMSSSPCWAKYTEKEIAQK